MSVVDDQELILISKPSLPGMQPSSPARQEPFRRWMRRALLGDVVGGGGASLAAMAIRFGWDDGQQGTTSYWIVGLLVTVTWPLLLAASGAYELRPSLFGVEELRRVLGGGLLLVAGTGMVNSIFRLNLSRGYFIPLVPAVVAGTAVWRSVLRTRMGQARAERGNRHRAIAVGPVAQVVQLCNDLGGGRPTSPIEIVAYVADDLEVSDSPPTALAKLQRLPDRLAIECLAETDVNIDLIVRVGNPDPEEMWVLGQRAHDLGVAVAIAPHRQDTAASLSMSYVPLGSTPLLMVETPTLRPVSVLTKSIMDRVIALVLLVVAAPVLALIALVIAIRDGRPVLFRQERVGRYGKPFHCLKFRTMCLGAEAQLPNLLALNEQVSSPLFKLRADPRVTRPGRWLRRHSLDELPQLFNVLAGDMSVVGPRPPLPNEVATYDIRTNRRLLVKPGITGLWQTGGRSDLPWDDGVYLDLMYVDHWSPLLDLVIMARTAATIIRPRGAY